MEGVPEHQVVETLRGPRDNIIGGLGPRYRGEENWRGESDEHVISDGDTSEEKRKRQQPRDKTMSNLQDQVQVLTTAKDKLKRDNDAIKAQLEALESQNRELQMKKKNREQQECSSLQNENNKKRVAQSSSRSSTTTSSDECSSSSDDDNDGPASSSDSSNNNEDAEKGSAMSSSSASSVAVVGRGKLPPKKKKSGLGKRDRSKLRKGKWTLEEEEYTSRIIHYFSTGLLTLPEGSTLRSFLAEKLNCDPMRITKKYAGASCLGRRAYQFRQRPQPSVAEIQLARAELDLLEQRFRLRVEEGRPGLPLPTPSIPCYTGTPTNNSLASAAALQSAFLNLAAASSSSSGVAPNPLVVPQQPAISLPQAAAAPPPLILPQPQVPQQPQLSQSLPTKLMLQSIANNPLLSALALQQQQQQQQPQPQPQTQNTGLDKVLASLLLAQAAAASLPQPNQTQAAPSSNPILSLSNALGVPPAPAAPAPILTAAPPAVISSANHAQQLKAAFEEHLKSQNISLPKPPPPPPPPPKTQPSIPQATATIPATTTSQIILPTNVPQKPATVAPATASIPPGDRKPASSASPQDNNNTNIMRKPGARTEDDKDAGNILMGFLSSLRDSYEMALGKQPSGSSKQVTPPLPNRDASGATKRSVANVTDSSSQPNESSVEDSDWNSERKTDPSSSEDSDRDDNNKVVRSNSFSKGPPRKRLKTMGKLAKHNAHF